jgi:hypothetical protein
MGQLLEICFMRITKLGFGILGHVSVRGTFVGQLRESRLMRMGKLGFEILGHVSVRGNNQGQLPESHFIHIAKLGLEILEQVSVRGKRRGTATSTTRRWLSWHWTPYWHSRPPSPTGPTTERLLVSATSATTPSGRPTAAGSEFCSTTVPVLAPSPPLPP